jgi:nucleoside-diphosphate-sugar epimerase
MIFLTGGTGMLGAHLLLDLTRSGIKVRALKRKNSDLPGVEKVFSWYTPDAAMLFGQIEWVEGDLLDRTFLREALDGAESIIHAAARVSFQPKERQQVLHENIQGTASLVDMALEMNTRRFCHVSSIASLGDQDSGLPVNEDFSWKNDRRRSSYSESKFQSEMEVWRGIQEGLDCVIVNPSIILGPGKWDHGSPRFFRTVRNGMKFYTSGGSGFVDARDVSRAIIALLQPEGWESVKNQRYILSAENLSYRELFGAIAEALNQPKPTIPANRLLMQIARRAAGVLSLVTGKDPVITRETARSSMKLSAYDGSKITRTINFNYTPVGQTILDIGKIFLDENR